MPAPDRYSLIRTCSKALSGNPTKVATLRLSVIKKSGLGGASTTAPIVVVAQAETDHLPICQVAVEIEGWKGSLSRWRSRSVSSSAAKVPLIAKPFWQVIGCSEQVGLVNIHFGF
ncbi:hypothetical protein [Mesorhizobium sp.]|uniref:hypothetical protein n=1 Tax=Mesorhizobium sp. TaxID=1871066 RepID=UPI0025C6AAA2|nr:hypothetical protein [Mesorhizobium sp.]